MLGALQADRQQSNLSGCSHLLDVQQEGTPLYYTRSYITPQDLFESKIKKCPITECPTFKDYAGNGEIMECLNFIAGKYKAQVTTNPERVQVSFVAAR